MAVRDRRIRLFSAKWAQLAVVRERGIKSDQIRHFDFRTAERKRQAVKRLRPGQRNARAAEKFVERRICQLRCQFNRRKIPTASQCIAGTDRSEKVAIEIFGIVIAETTRRIGEARQRMNQALIERKGVNER